MMKNLVKILVSVLMVMCTVSTTAWADTSEVLSSTYIAENDPNISQIVINSKRLSNYEILSYNGKTGVVSFNYQNYNKLEDKQDFLVGVLSSVNKSGLGVQRKNKLYNFIAQQDGSLSAVVKKLTVDGSSDFYTAASWLHPFSDAFSTGLGMVVIVMFMLMSFSVILDISVITLPGLRLLASTEGTGKVKSKISSLVSADCRYAIKVEDTSGKSAIFVWMRRRAITLGVVSVLLLWLVAGTFYDNIAWILYALGVGNA